MLVSYVQTSKSKPKDKANDSFLHVEALWFEGNSDN